MSICATPLVFLGLLVLVCKIKKSQAVVKWIPSEFNLADLLTKSSRNLALFNCLRDHIM